MMHCKSVIYSKSGRGRAHTQSFAMLGPRDVSTFIVSERYVGVLLDQLLHHVHVGGLHGVHQRGDPSVTL